MIIEVNAHYHYNAPSDIKVGDIVRLPHTLNGAEVSDGEWKGTVTAIDAWTLGDYTGPIASIIGQVEPVRATVFFREHSKVFHASTHRELREQIHRWLVDKELKENAS